MEYVKCGLCNSDDASLLFSVKNNDYLGKDEIFSIVKCNNCSFVYTNPRPDRIEVSKYYPQSYYGKDNVRFNKIVEYVLGLIRKNRARAIASLMSPGRILDIGCGRGKMLSFLKKKKWQTIGTEISAEACRYAQEYLNLEVVPKDLPEIKFPDSYFDVITLFNSLEHLSNPREVLNECKRILKPAGWLIIALPNIDSIQTRIFKNRWFHLDLPRHYSHFSLSTLKEMLNIAGFEIYKLKHFSLEYGPYGVLQSLLNQLRLPYNMLYDVFKSKTAKVIKNRDIKYYLQILIMISILPFLAVITMLICIAELMLRKGGMIKVYVRQLNN